MPMKPEKNYPRRSLMTRRRLKHLAVLVSLLFLVSFYVTSARRGHSHDSRSSDASGETLFQNGAGGSEGDAAQEVLAWSGSNEGELDDSPRPGNTLGSDDEGDEEEEEEEGEDYDPKPDHHDYRELFSLTTTKRKFYPLYFSGAGAYNGNLLPHPTKHDEWIAVAKHEQSHEKINATEELICNVFVFDDVLVCDGAAGVVPTAPSITGLCDASHAKLYKLGGPRDARVFYGPDAPYYMYGSQSAYACLGVWVQDARMLFPQFELEQPLSRMFTAPTEIRRPAPWDTVEKNFFLFWDSQGQVYAHYDLYPKRAFAAIGPDGSPGEDLAPAAASRDQICMAKYMPTVGPGLQTIQQATNSLSITLCERQAKSCTPSDQNTFLMSIFHHKSESAGHAEFEPYLILMQRHAPFALHAIAQRPFWIHGRNRLTNKTNSVPLEGTAAADLPKGHTELFYFTTMSWKTHGQKYHGHIDDPVFLAFGVEDTSAGAIDVMASDLVQDLAFC